jgi:CCR4-NOT transcription complex subunit 4
MNKNKKQAAAKRKETEKKEVEASSRRNLAGVRVKQQNLVYVIGLVPSMKDESTLLQTLRGPEYFGQYGDIDKIVVSKAKPGAVNQGIGVYVTYARKEDAALCIQTIDGSANGDRVLRAQFGTTKYCSAFLRGETCMNKSCSFLHETGEDGHNSSLQNEPHIKKPAVVNVPSGMAPPPRPQSTAQSVSSQPMARQGSKDSDGRKGSTDASALPSTASWATTGAPKAIRRPSQSTSRATPSPQLTHSALASQKTESKPKEQSTATSKAADPAPIPLSISTTSSKASPKPQNPIQAIFDNVIKNVSSQPFRFVFNDSCLSQEEKEQVDNFPVMIDPYGGAKRRVMQDKEAAERARIEAEAKAKFEAQMKSTAEEALEDENMGSLALGGEPEDNPRSISARGAIGRPSHPSSAVANQLANLDIRSLTPQQRQPNVQQAPGLPQPPTGSTAFEMSDFDRRAPTFSQSQFDQISNHQRHGSRYFNNESKAAATSRFPGQQQSFYSGGVQGPPPGLPASGTPPVSGGGMFAHGNNFSNPGFGTSKDANAELTMRGRSGTNDVSKRELLLSLQNPLRSPQSAPVPAPGLLNLYGQYPGTYQDPGLVKQRKKGKKQRHANTSSSGGGVEHLADPSIVQARLHQGNNAGQGLFGGNQGGYQQHSNVMYSGSGGSAYRQW